MSVVFSMMPEPLRDVPERAQRIGGAAGLAMVLGAIAKAIVAGDHLHVILDVCRREIGGSVPPESPLRAVTIAHDRGGQGIAVVVFGDNVVPLQVLWWSDEIVTRFMGRCLGIVHGIVAQILSRRPRRRWAQRTRNAPV